MFSDSGYCVSELGAHNLSRLAGTAKITLYHFFDATRQESCTLRALLGSLASQLLHQETTSRQPLVDLKRACGTREPSLPELEETTLLLFRRRHSVNAFTRTYVVIDALDEVDPPQRGPKDGPLPNFRSAHDTKEVVAFIRALHGLGTQTSLLVASRPAFSDVGALRRLFTVSVDMQDVGLSHDVELVVARAFADGGLLENVHTDLQPVIRDRLLSNTGASFLWVTLQIQALSEYAEVPTELEQHLAKIPLDLEGTYNAALSPRPYYIRRLLVWMAEDAIGQVSPDMLIELLSGDHSDATRPDFCGRLKPTMDGVIRLIGTAFVTQTRPDSRDQTYIVFTHNTVKDFILQLDDLEDERRLHSIRISSMFAAYILDLSSDDICRVLVESYEPLDDFTRKHGNLLHNPKSVKDNLYTAAQQYWMPHLGRTLRLASTPSDLVEHAATVAKTLAHYFSSISRLEVYMFSPFGIRKELIPRNEAFTALSVACSFANVPLVEFLLDVQNWTPGQLSHALGCVSLRLHRRAPADIAAAESTPPVDEDPYKKAIEGIRAKTGSAEENAVARVVELVIKHGSHDPDSVGKISCTTAAIEYLCNLGYSGAIQHLCRAGLVDLNASINPEGDGETLPILTDKRSCSRRYRTLRRLAEPLERSEADIDGRPSSSTHFNPATSRFAFLDHIFTGVADISNYAALDKTVPLMKGFGVLGVPGFLGPILTGAAVCGSADVIRVLVENHPDVSSASEALASALDVAALAGYGHRDVLEVLIPHCSEQARVEAFLCNRWHHSLCDPCAMLFLPTLCGLTTPIAVHAYMLMNALDRGRSEMFSTLFELADAKVKGLVTYYVRFEMQAADRDGNFVFPPRDPEIMRAILAIAASDGRLFSVPHPGGGPHRVLAISLSPKPTPSED